jgi:hypothetical protein
MSKQQAYTLTASETLNPSYHHSNQNKNNSNGKGDGRVNMVNGSKRSS